MLRSIPSALGATLVRLVSGGATLDISPDQTDRIGPFIEAHGMPTFSYFVEEAEPMSTSLASDSALDCILSQVRAEGREDHTVSSQELPAALSANGVVRLYGLSLTDHAMRQLVTRLDSPSGTYVRALAAREGDAAWAAEVLAHEAQVLPEQAIVLRTRASREDIYAVVSPSYSRQDVTDLAPSIREAIDPQAKATSAYDPRTTAWHIRLDAKSLGHVVGEPCGSFLELASADSGQARFRASGGTLVLICSNGATLSQSSTEGSRVHRGNARVDVSRMLRSASIAVESLSRAWAKAKEDVVPRDETIPLPYWLSGTWRALMTDRASELVPVLSGRTEHHVKALTALYETERREPNLFTRADFAQTWTRYAQRFDAITQRAAESAAGRFLTSTRPLRYEAA